tara:strand:- start:20895 stop:21773 length:879 start_codon:yes stop_codon:yes gene_type:complete
LTNSSKHSSDKARISISPQKSIDNKGSINLPSQTEMPFAIIQGEPQFSLPQDLYIPPDALEVFLDAFEGPLDLLLYLIRRQNLDILDIPIFEITTQYVKYIELMKEIRFELAAEYLVMAAMLAEIKSRMLLPRVNLDDEDEDLDPRAELVRRLQEYERFKQAAEDIKKLPQMNRDIFSVRIKVSGEKTKLEPPKVDLGEVLTALNEVLQRAEMFVSHQIKSEPLSMRERMGRILESIDAENFIQFSQLFDLAEGKAGVVVTFMAILELMKQQLIELVQAESYAMIHVKLRNS